MRKYAYLKEPLHCHESSDIVKIMLYETKEGFYLFGYCSLDAVQCSSDRCYASLEDLYGDWNDLIDERGWIEIEDPLPGCQHDGFIPIRVKAVIPGNRSGENLKYLKRGNGSRLTKQRTTVYFD